MSPAPNPFHNITYLRHENIFLLCVSASFLFPFFSNSHSIFDIVCASACVSERVYDDRVSERDVKRKSQ